MTANRAAPPSPTQLANLWEKTGGKAWEPPNLRHPSVSRLIEDGWVKPCTMRCGFEAFDTGVNWTEAARAYFSVVPEQPVNVPATSADLTAPLPRHEG